MVRQVTCSFCGREIRPGTGFMYVKTDGTILWFCSRRCFKYMIEQKKKARKLKWTVAGKQKQ